MLVSSTHVPIAPGTSPSGLHDLLQSYLRVLVAPAHHPCFALVTSELQVTPTTLFVTAIYFRTTFSALWLTSLVNWTCLCYWPGTLTLPARLVNSIYCYLLVIYMNIYCITMYILCCVMALHDLQSLHLISLYPQLPSVRVRNVVVPWGWFSREYESGADCPVGRHEGSVSDEWWL